MSNDEPDVSAMPEFRLRLPRGGPEARGRLLPEPGPRGGQRFLVLSGSPVRDHTVESFGPRGASSHRTRQRLIADQQIVESRQWPGLLEAAEDITFDSPSAAASVLLGRSANGWIEWATDDGRHLGDFFPGLQAGANRAWLVRASEVAGSDVVQRLWRSEGLVTLWASHLRPDVQQGISKDRLRTIIEEDFESTLTYSQRRRLIEDIHAFLSRMKPGDTVCTLSEGRLYIGEIDGRAKHLTSEDGRSNLRRPVAWEEQAYPYVDLPESLQQKLSIQQDVVDLTRVKSLIDGLGRSDAELVEEINAADGDVTEERATLIARQAVELPEPTEDLAVKELVHDVAWLRELRGLLSDDRQLVFYGPPGTGKTHLALYLAEFLAGAPERVKLVQFHPEYAYETFIEGIRPQENKETGDVSFRIAAGPLRELADLADKEGNRHIPHFLVIDEINRANLAKVFGELYFLLEYRNHAVRLTYSGDDFYLPSNLYIIGTMNTADRTIATVDTAMRRRFAFVELSPGSEPTRGLLRRWLESKDRDSEPADLLDELNTRILDPDFRIGPAYLMKPGVYREGGLERTWRTKILPLLVEHHYGEDIDIEARYGLEALRAAITGD